MLDQLKDQRDKCTKEIYVLGQQIPYDGDKLVEQLYKLNKLNYEITLIEDPEYAQRIKPINKEQAKTHLPYKYYLQNNPDTKLFD